MYSKPMTIGKLFQEIFQERKKIIKSFLFAFLLTLALKKLVLEVLIDEIPIFGFHDIVDIQLQNDRVSQDKNILPSYPKQDLEEFLGYLIREDYWFLSTQELYNYFLANPKQPIPPQHAQQKPVMITFDDGYESIHTQLLPILENLENKYGKKAKVVLFVNAGFMGDKGSRLYHATCKELNEGLVKGFFDIQSHGLHHKKLTELAHGDLEQEISEDQKRLRKCTAGLDKSQTVASHIAYPFGATDERVEKYIAKYYLSGYLYNSRTLKLGWNRNEYRIPRLTVNMEKSVDSLIKLASGGWF
ncbi:polysaccharide deacetylase family protein [Limnofasciculus baicalensis]|uniref:Polysaccharide deacetylase family protein n=1 Tax=Limnofasciculus baicalensis BBK-W-15 TaxID=2699891 RepID=A0AAE3H1L0_9CYAN|nr:polysaccharide deacetylase family protein [Limnofasciculus baicalensis]MCP2732532.1 polysaccharide deacetylase family protein [Limnofasciculus baicalensis BBK-W-15]